MNYSSLSLDVHLESEIEPTLKFNPPHVGFLLACIEEVLKHVVNIVVGNVFVSFEIINEDLFCESCCRF